MPDKRKLAGFIFLAILFTTLLFQTAFSSLVYAQTQAVTDDEVNEVAKDLYCPVCESTPLDVCPTQACADWREVIREKLGQGQTPEEIRDYFALQYGPRALAEPAREGFSLAVWIIPIAAIILGGFLFTRYLRGIRVKPGHDMAFSTDVADIDGRVDDPASEAADSEAADSEAADSEAADSEDYEARIEQELREKYS
jgi:cytochrome c-type biogenesis protein CcmH